MPTPVTDITLAVDQNGCLIAHPADEWLVCFVPAIKTQWWHWMFSWMKHCFCMKRQGEHWLLFEPWWSRIMLCVLTDAEAERFLTWGRRGIILSVPEHIPGTSNQLRIWMSCAALIAHLLGRGYWVWTPRQLHARLSREPNVRLVHARERGEGGGDSSN